MQLETVSIKGFRSISAVALLDCGGFNVLIGKNNAGKSNILLAINLFFEALRSSQPVIVDPVLTRAFDHHKSDPLIPIELLFDFKLTLAERDSLIGDIVSEAPQVKHAVEGIDPELRIRLTLAFFSAPRPFAYVKEIILHKTKVDEAAKVDVSARTLLRIDDSSANELAGKASDALTREQDAKFIRDYVERMDRIGTDDWERVRMELSRTTRMMMHYEPSSRMGSAEIQSRLDQIGRVSDSKATFKEAAEGLANSISEEAQSLRSQSLENRIESISGKEPSIPAYALRLIARVAELKVLFLKERREPIGAREAAQLLDLKVTRGGPEKLRGIQETVTALLGVEIDAFKAPGRPGRQENAAELDVDRFLVQVNGAGIREALRLILDYEFAQPDILLVEEPEVHLHPALETSMMRYLKRTGKECQIFITTHSTNFLDTAEMRNVYLASKNHSTKVQLINLAEAEAVVPRELGIRLSSLFMFDKLVFVEGPSDEDVFREWASVIDVNLAQASVGFIPMGGVRNLAQFAAERTIAFLTKRRVMMWFVLDRDEREDEEVKRLGQLLGLQAILSVLDRREIENYLIIPRPLCEFIKIKRTLGGGKERERPDEAEVAATIEECAESLKEVALERRLAYWACKPIYVDRTSLLDIQSGKPLTERLSMQLEKLINGLTEKLQTADSTIESLRNNLEQKWKAEKTHIVPGDSLLDEVCKRFGVRFMKEKDSARLAALMRKDEVQPDIRRLLEDIRDRQLKA